MPLALPHPSAGFLANRTFIYIQTTLTRPLLHVRHNNDSCWTAGVTSLSSLVIHTHTLDQFLVLFNEDEILTLFPRSLNILCGNQLIPDEEVNFSLFLVHSQNTSVP
jgi:hypothetical protein